MIKQGNKVISNTQIKILSSSEITKETIEKVLTGEITSHTHDGIYVKKDDPRLSDSRPASDVSAWAKNATKPSYSASEITGLANVAKTGSYNDLSNKPTIPTVDVNKAYVDGALATKADLVSGKIPLSQLPEIPSPITVDSALSSTSTNPVQNKVISASLNNKVDKVSDKQLSTNDYTTQEKNKLSRISWIVDRGLSIQYEENQIKLSMHSIDPNDGAENTSSSYIGEANSSRAGVMTASDKNKLNGIATGANNYIHPTTSGNKHIPAGGASGQILRWSSDGTAVWGADNNTTYSVVGANGSTGLVKNGSSVTNASGYTTCPIVGGVPYYKDTTYTLPTATGSTLGGVKTGANITNSSGTISITKSNISSALGYTPEKECLLIEYVGDITTKTSMTITETQFNDIWNAVKDNRAIKLKMNSPESNFYISFSIVGGICYGPEAVICNFGGIMSDNPWHLGCNLIAQKSITNYTLDISPIEIDLTTTGKGDRFLANNGIYMDLPSVSTTRPGMVSALPDDATKFLDGKGNWSTVNTALAPGVFDVFTRLTEGVSDGATLTVTQAEYDILVAATPELDKGYFFSVNNGFTMDGPIFPRNGNIVRSESSISIIINAILPQYPQYLLGFEIDTTTKICKQIANASLIMGVGNNEGISINAITVDGDNQYMNAIGFQTNGDGSKALMDNGNYKNVLPYIIPKAVANLTKSSTPAEIETAFGGKEQMYKFVETVRNNGTIFMEDTPILGSKIGFWPVAIHVLISTTSNISIVIKGQFSDKKCGEIGLGFNNASSVSSISPSIYAGYFSIYDPNPLINLPIDFNIGTTYTSDQIKSMLPYTSWESFYNSFQSQYGRPLVKLSFTSGEGTTIFYCSPIECCYLNSDGNIGLSMAISGYGTLFAGSSSGSIIIIFSYSATSSTYSLNTMSLE